jgi:hypothetical protein
MNPKTLTFRILVLLFCLGLLLAACGPKTTPAAPTTEPQPSYPAAGQLNPDQTAAYPIPAVEAQPAYPSPGLTIQITKPDGSTTMLNDADLRNMPPAQISVGDKIENGISLGTLLNMQGIAEFQQLIVTGSGANLTLSREQAISDVILSFAADGSVQLLGSKLTEDQWVQGVSKVEVK